MSETTPKRPWYPPVDQIARDWEPYQALRWMTNDASIEALKEYVASPYLKNQELRQQALAQITVLQNQEANQHIQSLKAPKFWKDYRATVPIAISIFAIGLTIYLHFHPFSVANKTPERQSLPPASALVFEPARGSVAPKRP